MDMSNNFKINKYLMIIMMDCRKLYRKKKGQIRKIKDKQEKELLV